MEQCNFQLTQLTHISLCETDLPEMNLPEQCGVSTCKPAFLALLWGEIYKGPFNILFQRAPLPNMKTFFFFLKRVIS